MSFLEVRQLNVAYNRVPALRGIDLTVERGEIVALIGPNGAGKTTTLSAIFGLVAPERGSVRFEGRELIGLVPEAIVRRGLALVPEGRHIFQSMTVAENLALGSLVNRHNGGRGRGLDDVFEIFPVLREYYASPASRLSGGEQQQLAIARALLSGPRLLLLDEPSLGLAPQLVDMLFTVMAELRERGTTILLVEQNARRTLRFADGTYLLRAGRMELGRLTREMADDPGVVNAYLGGRAVSDLFQHLVDIVTLGSLYALLGLGITLIFGVMRLINFAYGELIMVSAYVPALLLHTPWPVVILVSLIVPVLFALAMERVAFRPIRGASEGTMLIASFALSYLLQNLALLIFGATPRTTSFLSGLNDSVRFLGLTVPKLSIVTVVVTAALLAALSYFLARTPGGMQMRAAAEDFRMARVLGVRANRVIAWAFAMSGLLCGVSAVLIVAQTGTVTPTFGLDAVLVAFIATILGGMGSPSGAVAGGFALAAFTVILESALPPGLRPFRDAFAYSLVVAVLIYRPHGLVTPRGAEMRV